MDKYPHELVLESLNNFFVKVLLLFVSATLTFTIGVSAIYYYIDGYSNETTLYTNYNQVTYNGSCAPSLINPAFYVILLGITMVIIYFLIFRKRID